MNSLPPLIDDATAARSFRLRSARNLVLSAFFALIGAPLFAINYADEGFKIPDATVSIWNDAWAINYHDPVDRRNYSSDQYGESYVLNQTYGAYALSEASASPAPAPSVFAHSVAGGDVRSDSTTEAILTYYFRINGPAGAQANVQIDAEGFISTYFEDDAIAVASASFTVANLVGSYTYQTIVSKTLNLDWVNGYGEDSFHVHDVFSLPVSYSNFLSGAGQLPAYKVTLSVHTGAYRSYGGGVQSEDGFGTATAFIDPVFTVVGPDAGLFALEFSPGISNEASSPSVPENNATLILLTTALAMLPFFGRRIAIHKA